MNWDYIGDCSSKVIVYSGECLWEAEHQPFPGSFYIQPYGGETGATIGNASPYSKYYIQLHILQWDSTPTYNGTCTTPQLGELIL